MCGTEIDFKTKEIYFNFFARFSRFEYCLKKHGYRNGTKPGWSRFVTEFSKQYLNLDSHDLLKNNYLLRCPPHKILQYNNDNNPPQWQVVCTKNLCELKKTEILLKTVRNNLFHGDKHGDKNIGDQRGIKLLKAGIYILDTLAYLPDLQKRGFWDDYKIVTEI